MAIISNVIIFILFIILILIICFIVIQCIKKDKYYGGDKNNLKHSDTSPTSTSETLRASELVMTYTISGENNGLDHSQLRLLLKERSDSINGNKIIWKEKSVTENVHVSFGTFGSFMHNGKLLKDWSYDPLFFKQKAAIKNTLGAHNSLINKSQLYSTIKKIIPNGIKYLPLAINIDEINKKEITYPIIVKKDNSNQQKGVIIVTSEQDFNEAKKQLYKIELERANKLKIAPSYEMGIFEYITNPLLIEGKKFHFRIYFLLNVSSGITRCTVFNEYLILTAKDNYIKGDWHNTNIHLSGWHSTPKIYYYPDDLKKEYSKDFDTIETNLNKFNKVICMALTVANIKNYPESYSGYQIYGIDAMITDEYKPYLLEINTKSGFLDKAISSRTTFSFILKYMIYPFFGIIRFPIYEAEFIGNGILTPYANILTGDNKFILIPYLDSTKNEIDQAKKINFFNENISFSHILDSCNYNNIFLIGRGHHNIIGYLSISNSNNLTTVILEKYQNRGIATAMIAQFLDIYYMRNFTMLTNKIIYIDNRNIFMTKIAKKLHFIKSDGNHYEFHIFNYSNLKNKLYHHHNKLLTYKIISENNTNIDFKLDKYMSQSNSQFVHFVYTLLSNDITILKHSTGNKYNKEFIYQGAELKSALDIKILYGLFLFKLWYGRQHNGQYDENILTIFDKRIENKTQIQPNNKYEVYDHIKKYHQILHGRDIKEEYYDYKNYIIDEYTTPYLLDKKLMLIVFYIIIYVTKNGIIRFYIFPKNSILTPKDEYNNLTASYYDKTTPKYTYTAKKYNVINELKHVMPNNTIEDLYPIIINFFKKLTQYDIKPYDESNSGFLECALSIKFIKSSDGINYTPIIANIYNNISMQKNNIIDEQFVNEYYQWIQNSIILHHFGLITNNKKIIPHYGAMSKFEKNYSNIKYSIIEKLHLEFNDDRSDIQIYYNERSIGNIKLNLHKLQDYIIEIIGINCHKDHNNEITLSNILFILMEILSSYYAPLLISLIINHKIINKKIDNIAFELEFSKSVFQKTKEEYYIRKCRI